MLKSREASLSDPRGHRWLMALSARRKLAQRRQGAMPQFNEMRRPALWDDYRASGRESRHNPAAARTVVVGYDGSQAARRALRRAVEAARAGGHVVLVTATHEPETVAVEPGTGSVAEPSRLLEEAAAELAGHGVHVSMRIEAGEPAEALAAVARHVNAALIIVGASGDNYPARALRGSVGGKLIARAQCDLLIAR